MAEYIAREAIKKHFKDRLDVSNPGSMGEAYYAACMDILDTQPAADVRPVVRGRFEYISPGRPQHEGFYQCSACAGTTLRPTKFCPNCGADMREGIIPMPKREE